MSLPHFGGNWKNPYAPKNRLDKMINNHGSKTGIIKFKYYGDFDVMKRIHGDCKDDLNYIGNSRIDGAPVFVYYYNNIDNNVIRDFDALNKVLRKIKIKHYSKKELTKKELSLFSFLMFFMIAHDNFEIKGLNNFEINEVSFNTQ